MREKKRVNLKYFIDFLTISSPSFFPLTPPSPRWGEGKGEGDKKDFDQFYTKFDETKNRYLKKFSNSKGLRLMYSLRPILFNL